MDTRFLNLRMAEGVSRWWRGLEGVVKSLAGGALGAGFSEVRSKVNRSGFFLANLDFKQILKLRLSHLLECFVEQWFPLEQYPKTAQRDTGPC